MPPRPLRPCKGNCCRALTRDRSGYCDECRPAAEAKLAATLALREQQRGTAASRGYDYAWTKIRREVMRRHQGLCADCRAQGLFIRAVEVHHVDGDSRNNDFSNLAPLCREHHDKRHGVVRGRRVRIRR